MVCGPLKLGVFACTIRVKVLLELCMFMYSCIIQIKLSLSMCANKSPQNKPCCISGFVGTSYFKTGEKCAQFFRVTVELKKVR